MCFWFGPGRPTDPLHPIIAVSNPSCLFHLSLSLLLSSSADHHVLCSNLLAGCAAQRCRRKASSQLGSRLDQVRHLAHAASSGITAAATLLQQQQLLRRQLKPHIQPVPAAGLDAGW